jgi:photosystem II stability/assembly factor-like uncharacterized protein
VLLLGSNNVAFSQWTKVFQTPYFSGGFRIPLSGMAFFGHDTGSVCSGTSETAMTTNGGVTWHDTLKSGLSGEFSTTFTDINHIWFCSYGNSTDHHTSNGGVSWEVDTNRDSLGYTVESIYFVDSLVGFEGGGGLMMFRTSDGGKNWMRVHDPETNDYSDYEVLRIQFCTPLLGLAVCGRFGTYVLRTTDGGITWKNLTNINQGVAGIDPTSLCYLNPQNAWFTDFFSLYHSTDSGLTWTQVGSETPLGGLFRSVAFADPLHGVATAGVNSRTDTMYIGYTSDGGNTWQTVFVDSEGSDGIASFPDTTAAYVGGYDAVFKLMPQDLSVQQKPHDSTGVSIESEGGNLFLVMPQNAGGRLRIIDALGRVLEDELLLPGARSEIGNTSQPMPQFRFAEVECNGRVQVFKVAQ